MYEAFGAAEYCAVGTIEEVARPGQSSCYYKLKINIRQALKGKPEKKVSVCLPGVVANANYDIRVHGHEGIFFLKKEKGTYSPLDAGAWVVYIEAHGSEQRVVPSGRITDLTSANVPSQQVPSVTGVDLGRLLSELQASK